MRTKVKPSYQLDNDLAEILSGSFTSKDLLSELLRLGAQRILQQALEGEVDEFLERGWYERNKIKKFRGYRNGYTPIHFKTTEGKIAIQRPRVRDTDKPFESSLLARIDRLEERLVKMAGEMYARGLSTRDIEETLTDSGGKPVISRTAASRLSETLYDEYEEWQKKDLSGYDVVYLFVDAVYESVKAYTNNQSILCAWGICSDGRKVMLGLEAVQSESAACWTDFFNNLVERGLDHPLLVISDGAKGLIKAISECFPFADRGRCTAHKMRNLMNKLPRDKQITEPIKARLREVFYASTLETAQGLAKAFIKDYADQYPNMVNCFQEDLEACLIHLKYPLGHRRFIRTTNLIERAFVEQKRRTKVIPTHQNEKSAMKLVFATLIRASDKWKRVNMELHDLALLRNIRKMICNEKNVTLNNERISFKRAA
jgi:putative transposase